MTRVKTHSMHRLAFERICQECESHNGHEATSACNAFLLRDSGTGDRSYKPLCCTTLIQHGA